MFKNSTSLANGTGLVMTALNETGIYSCVASNEAGTDSRDLSVTIVDCGNLCSSHGKTMDNQVENEFWCDGSDSSVDILKCLPSTATTLTIKGMKMRYLPKEAFRHMTALKYLNITDNEIEVLPEVLFSELFSLQEL
ncbi:uncharacterized protein LOC110057925 [Orbicella faveolata]|uniref:uncharacterized protein LOC110057925 n=1 Tax=Orbicella faveolata TaxID=48498 RepID=UPI0009E2F2EA|nr:uncharacterized protein LOC110057925 [Orbicella faveolata]